jgi:hypothetical protein
MVEAALKIVAVIIPKTDDPHSLTIRFHFTPLSISRLPCGAIGIKFFPAIRK